MSSEMAASLEDLIQKFAAARVLCVGDLILDTFNHGSVERISPERPVPVVRPGKAQHVLGGAANVANNVTALGAACTLVGLVGEDEGAVTLREEMAANAKLTPRLVTAKDRPTTHKIRFTAGGQHLLRIDTEDSAPISAEIEVEILKTLGETIPQHDVLILSDYAKGLLTRSLVAEAISIAKKAGVPVVVDPKTNDFSHYKGATIITPNALEAERATGRKIKDDDAAVAAGQTCLEAGVFDAVLITRGPQGMSLISRDEPPLHLESEALEVFDVVGAGDTVIAALSCTIAVGGTLSMATFCANTAAGIVVAKKDTATVAPDELLDRLARLDAGWVRAGAPIMLDRQDAAAYVAARKAEGKRVGFTNGVFDIVHPGHVWLLKYSRSTCDCLVVGINSDASVRRLGKGPERPINTEEDRATVLGAFGTVDAIIIFDEDTPLEIIRAIEPDVLIKGADYTVETVVGSDIVLAKGGEVKLAPLIPEKSSTRIIKKAMQASQ